MWSPDDWQKPRKLQGPYIPVEDGLPDGESGEPDDAAVPETHEEASGWSPRAVVLGVVLALLTWQCCQLIVQANTPDAGSDMAPPQVWLTIILIPPLLILAGVLAVIAGHRARVLRVPVGIMLAIVVATWGVTWISNASQTYVTPQIAGVVAAINDRSDGVEEVSLADGRVLDLVYYSQTSPRPRTNAAQYAWLAGDSQPEVGDLVLAGKTPNAWYAGFSKRDWGNRLC